MPEQIPAGQDFQQRLQSIEHLLSRIEASTDPSLRASVQELLQIVMDLHGAGLERMLELVAATGEGGAGTLQRLGRDELVGSLLILYGLHPADLETRVAQALDKIRHRLRAHDGEVELVEVHEDVVRLRLSAKGHGCGSTPQALREMVEQAVYGAAPDVTTLIVEGTEDADTRQGFVPLAMLLNGSGTLIPGDPRTHGSSRILSPPAGIPQGVL